MTTFLRKQIANALHGYREMRDNKIARRLMRDEVIARRAMLAAWDPTDRAAHGRLVGSCRRMGGAL